MGVIGLVVVMVAATMGNPSQVIAAPLEIDQHQLDSRASQAGAVLAFYEVKFYESVWTFNIDLSAITLGEWLLAVLALLVVLAFFIRGWCRLNDAPRRPVMFPPLIGFALGLAMIAAGAIGAGLASLIADIPMNSGGDSDVLSVKHLAQLAIGAYAGQAIILFIFARQRTQSLRLGPGKGARPSRLKAALLGVAALLLAWPVVMVAGHMAGLIVGAPDDPIAHDSLRAFANAKIDGWFIAFALIVTIVAPLTEEVLYRGLVQESLVTAGLARWGAILIVSPIFAVMHNQSVEPHALASLFVLSIAFGWMYEKTGRLTAPIVMHMLFNAGNLAMAMAMTRG